MSVAERPDTGCRDFHPDVLFIEQGVATPCSKDSDRFCSGMLVVLAAMFKILIASSCFMI